MQRVSLNVFAAVLSSVVLLGVSSLTAYADFNPHPNPNNRGHHYGWAKHNHTPPPPAPAPVPAPAPAPASGGSSTHGSGVVTAVHGSGAQAGIGLDLDLQVLKLVPTRQTADANVNPIEPLGGDPWWWLILLLPPTLAALWAIAFRRLVVGREGQPRSAGVAGAPAL